MRQPAAQGRRRPDAGAGAAEPYPSRNIRIVIPGGPGTPPTALATNVDSCWISQSDDHTATFRPPSLTTSSAHTLYVEARDNFGNPTLISRTIYVDDTTPPDLTLSIK